MLIIKKQNKLLKINIWKKGIKNSTWEREKIKRFFFYGEFSVDDTGTIEIPSFLEFISWRKSFKRIINIYILHQISNAKV